MSRMIDAWHDLYHVGTVIDLINCPHCQDEFMMAELVPVDRLEDLEVA